MLISIYVFLEDGIMTHFRIEFSRAVTFTYEQKIAMRKQTLCAYIFREIPTLSLLFLFFLNFRMILPR